jgi:Flp pilus assembly protein TadD
MVLSDRPLSNAQQHADEVRQGIACLDKAIELRPDYWQALWARGKAYQVLGEMQDARDSFRSAYTFNPENPDVGRELVKAYIDLSDFSEAVPIAKHLADKFPTDAGLRANYALALLLEGQIGPAQTTVADALRLDPADSVTRALKVRIDDVASGKRARPRSLDDLER